MSVPISAMKTRAVVSLRQGGRQEADGGTKGAEGISDACFNRGDQHLAGQETGRRNPHAICRVQGRFGRGTEALRKASQSGRLNEIERKQK